MQGNENKTMRRSDISREMLKPAIGILLPMVLITSALIILLAYSDSVYSKVLHNATTAADFNTAFKTTIDSEMYTHVIRPRSETSLDELPWDEMDQTEAILRDLQETTVLEDNRWRVRSMLSMCVNLRQYMEEIALCPRYDDRMELLDRNIRGETGLTRLIESYMNAYLVNEVREMNRLQEQIGRRFRVALIIIGILLAVTLGTIVAYALRNARRISRSIEGLARKAQRFGSGDFSYLPIQTQITELETLNVGLDEMSQQIDGLITRQIHDQKALHHAELVLLQAQIDPHFLYNTLDSIAVLAEMHRDEDVISMVTWLSTFFRTCLSNGRDLIPLRDEVAHVTSYLEIQQVRYSNRMHFVIDVDENLLEHLVPKLILQPLVENALYHGIKNRRARGEIRITGASENGEILLTVADDGVGMTEEQLEKLRSSLDSRNTDSFGVSNVQQRIRLYCGLGYGLTFESESGVGTTVRVLLPGDLQPENDENTEAEA